MQILRFLIPLLLAPALEAASHRVRENFDLSWHFHRGDAPGAEKPGFDASGWRALDLPHDFTVEGPFDPKATSAAPGGYLPGDIAWYRKTFRVPEGSQGSKVFVEFDGAYMNSEVWINGHCLGKRPYGYLGFEYELTPHIHFTGENTIAVRLDNSKLPSARWYTGTGIYRHVWLKVTDPLRVAHWGTYVTTPEITGEKAKVAIETTVLNGLPTDRQVAVVQEILSNDGTVIARTEDTVAVKGEWRNGRETIARCHGACPLVSGHALSSHRAHYPPDRRGGKGCL